MSFSSFINSFKRFTAIRGSVKQIRSDRGTNFVCAMDDLKINVTNVEASYIVCRNNTYTKLEQHGFLTRLMPPIWAACGKEQSLRIPFW